MRFVLAAFLLSLGWSAQARVFSYKDSNLAAYLRTTGGLSSLGQTPFKEFSGADTSIDGSTKYQYSGEIGFLYGAGNFNVRVGAELIQHRPVSDAKGTDSSGAELFTLNSNVSAFNPNITFEYTFEPQGNTRFYWLAGAGLADVTVENSYAMTGAGSSAFSGVTDYKAIMSGTAASMHFAFGVETLFTDDVTFAADIGYRHLPVSSLKYKGDANTIHGGVAKGDPVLNMDGTKRTLNLSGLTVGLGFRFYLNFL